MLVDAERREFRLEQIRVPGDFVPGRETAHAKQNDAVVLPQAEKIAEHVGIGRGLVMIELAHRKRVGRQHAALAEQRFHFDEKFPRQHMLGNVLVIECVQHDEIVPRVRAQHALDEDAAVFLEYACCSAWLESEVFACDAYDRGIYFDRIDRRIREDPLKRAW